MPARAENLLPTGPLWGGLAADLGVFAAAWLAVIEGAAACVRALRRGRGGCVACGYDFRGLSVGAVCPECGAAPAPSA